MGENKFSPIVYESYYGGKQVFLTSVENIFLTSVENSFPSQFVKIRDSHKKLDLRGKIVWMRSELQPEIAKPYKITKPHFTQGDLRIVSYDLW